MSRQSAVELQALEIKPDSQPASIESGDKQNFSNDYYKDKLLQAADIDEDSAYSAGDCEGGVPASEKEMEENYFRMQRQRKLSKAPSMSARSIKTDPSTTLTTTRSHVERPVMEMQ